MAAPGPRRVLRLSPARPPSAGRDRAGGNQRQIPRLLPRENLDGNPRQPKLSGSARAGRRMVGHPRGCPTAGGRQPAPVKKRRWSATPGPCARGPYVDIRAERPAGRTRSRARVPQARPDPAHHAHHGRAQMQTRRHVCASVSARLYICVCARVTHLHFFFGGVVQLGARQRVHVCLHPNLAVCPCVRLPVGLSVCLSACMHVCMCGITVCL